MKTAIETEKEPNPSASPPTLTQNRPAFVLLAYSYLLIERKGVESLRYYFLKEIRILKYHSQLCLLSCLYIYITRNARKFVSNRSATS